MGFDHRNILRLSTDFAIGLFLLFALGSTVWVADEFLGWNLLPDWIDKYAQAIVVVFGVAAGLAVGTSALCSAVVIAESLARDAGAGERGASGQFGKIALGCAVAAVVVFIVLGKIDSLRKQSAATRHRADAVAAFGQQVKDMQATVVEVAGAFPTDLLQSAGSSTVSEADAGLLQFLSAAQASVSHRPEVSLLVRAAEPYRYCHLKLAAREERGGDPAAGRYVISRQFYLGFPTPAEAAVVQALFEGRVEPVESPLRGEVVDTTVPGSWQVLRREDRVAAVLLLRTGYRPPFDLHHAGPARPWEMKGTVP
jgi:uncharacterized membrane protein YccC